MVDDNKNVEAVQGFTLDEEERILARRYHQARMGKKSRRQLPGATLTMNSLMDLMVIILVFFLFNTQQQMIQPEMSDELFMPFSSAAYPLEDNMVITITKQAVLVNNSFVVEVVSGDIPENKRVSSTSPLIPDLQQAVEEVLHVQERWAVIRQEAAEHVCTIIADRETPYQVIAYVMMSASAGGVQRFKFAILQVSPSSLWGATST
ncbi:MAG: biopolymer transporter ExbD [Bradymonadales bacterium]|nr:biopolymer transporter ExbD [Bradymonadales bacterium]